MSALLLTPLLVFLLAFFVLPFGVMLYQSLYLSLLQSPAGSPMTFANYTKAFGDAFYVRVLLQTVALGVAGVTSCSSSSSRRSSSASSSALTGGWCSSGAPAP